MKELKPKKVKPRMRVLRVLPYKGSQVYIRQIDEEIFMYDLIFKDEIYSAYLIIKPKAKMNKLTEHEVSAAGALILTGAMATIDTLRGEKVTQKQSGVIDVFESARKVVN